MVYRRTNHHGSAPVAVLCLSLLFCALSANIVWAEDVFVANDTRATSLDPPQDSPPDAGGRTDLVAKTASDRSLLGADLHKELVIRSDKKTKLSEPGGLSLWRGGVALLAVLVLIIALAALWRRFNPAARALAQAGCMQVLVRTSITPKQSLCLIKLGNRLLLLGISPNHIASVATIDNPEEITHLLGLIESRSANSISATFSGIINREKQSYATDEDGFDLAESDNVRDEFPKYSNAKGELTNLLQKVKGLSRISFRS